MITIIKHGNKYHAKIKECLGCGCEFLYEDEDIKEHRIAKYEECDTILLYESEDIHGVIYHDRHSFKYIECPICGAEIIVFDEASE